MGVYWKWKHVLESKASLAERLKFWNLTVARSMLYGLATCRQNSFNAERLAIAQRAMVRRMLKLKRRPMGAGLEPWVDWQIRSLSKAKSVVTEFDVSITKALAAERAKWSGHVARYGTHNRPPHLLKHVLLWRNVYWWKWQQLFNDNPYFEAVKHQIDVGGLRRWEWHLSQSWINILGSPGSANNPNLTSN
jgi:hypothetical protein